MADSSSELEEDEEEILVYVEFDNCETNDVFSSENLKLDILGLDSEHPVMQVNGKFFEGTYEDAVGTYLFFDKDNNPSYDDPVFDKVPSVKYFNKTRKLLRMQRAFVVPRYEVVGDSDHSKCIPNIETIKEAGVPLKYQEEALSFWKNSRDTRLEALNQYLKKQQFRKELRLRGFEPDSASDEDNPFAMYKQLDDDEVVVNNENDNNDYDTQIEKLKNLQMTEQENDNLEKESKKLTVIDPGPSTSKSSVPWIDDNILEEPSAINKVKSIGRVREKVMKGKVQKRTAKKNKLPISQKNLSHSDIDDLQCSESSNINGHQNIETISTIETNLITISEQNIKIEEMEIDENVEESEKLLSQELGSLIKNEFPISEKEKRRQERIEAKKREISEKLKALGQNVGESSS